MKGIFQKQQINRKLQMDQDYLYSQLFSEPAPKKEAKKDSNPDVLNSLFTMKAPAPSKSAVQLKKKKSEEELNSYISRMTSKNSDKVKRQMQRYKEERTMPASILKQKRAIEAGISKNLTRPQQDSFSMPIIKKENKYMPVLYDPFAKAEPDTKPKKKTQPPTRNQDKYKEKVSKVESKYDKIQRKQNIQAKIPTKKGNVPQQSTKNMIQGQKRKTIQGHGPMKPTSKPNKQSYIKKKKVRMSSSSSSSSSSSESESADSFVVSQEQQDWHKQLEKITGYNPRDPKYVQIDKREIKESGLDRMFVQDKFSRKMGIRQQEEDMIREQMRLKRKMMKHKRP